MLGAQGLPLPFLPSWPCTASTSSQPLPLAPSYLCAVVLSSPACPSSGQFLSQILERPASLCAEASLNAPRASQGRLQVCGARHMQCVGRGAKGSPGGEWWGNSCSSLSALMSPTHPLLWGILMLPQGPAMSPVHAAGWTGRTRQGVRGWAPWRHRLCW